MEPIIVISELSHHFGKENSKVEIFKNINLSINKGDFVAIQGRSGSGKSTLLNLLGGFIKPNSGSINVNSQELSKMSENQLSLYRRHNVGFIFQSYHLFPNMSAVNNVEEPLFYAGMKKKLRVKHSQSMLAKVGLADRADHLTHQLSGGQQQRVSIARALVTDPQIILADEPTGNLDTTTENEIMDLILQINKELGKTIIMVTHNDHIAKLANRIIEIKDGNLKEFIQ